MMKQEKGVEVNLLKDRLSEAKATFVAEYRGLNVEQMTELRSKVREADASFRVVKNRLALRALEDVPMEGISDLLKGPNALATATTDAGNESTATGSVSTPADGPVAVGGLSRPPGPGVSR